MWDGARSDYSPANRGALLDILLLAAFFGSIAGAGKALADVASDEGTLDTAAYIGTLSSRFAHLFGDDAELLHDAWDAASVCPFALGTPPLSSIRPDLPLQRGYRRLPTNARILLLSFAAQSGNSAVLLNASVHARRTGLAVNEVHLALQELFSSHWLERRADISAGVVTASSAIFLALSAGPWSRRSRRS